MSPVVPPPLPPQRTSWLRRIVGCVAGLALSAVAAELCVRSFVGEQPKFPRHVVEAPWGLRYNQPGARYRHKSADVEVWFEINGQGMRAPRDFAYEKPAGTKRVLSLGDSFTVGYEVAGEDCFSSVLERELSARGVAVEVLNAGVSGFSTAEACLYLERELHRYQPDLVVYSFFENDLLDNVRTGLFEVVDGKLVARAQSYVPAGRAANLLNTNPVLSWLSQHSDAFSLAKESATRIAKRKLVEERAGIGGSSAVVAEPPPDLEAQRQHALLAAILERMHAWTSARGIPFVIQSIPFPAEDGSGALVDKFPHHAFDARRPGMAFLSMREVLEPFTASKPLYFRRSHSHWTPFAHARSGAALAELVLREKLLDAAR
jgi:lysophospholipase L1-like esterase